MTVAIHQPNYMPWLGYFAKIARAQTFVFLDDVQFSKGSYTNRVKIARGGEAVWLTEPVRLDFGDDIDKVAIARPDWAKAHRDTLKNAYRAAAAFREVFPEIEAMLLGAVGPGLAEVNAGLIRAIAARLGLEARFVTSSEFGIAEDDPTRRLAAIASALEPGGTYLSGAGGAKYQEEEVFAAAGLTLAYNDFRPEPYERSGEPFIAGLSVVDALFHLGFEKTAELVRA